MLAIKKHVSITNAAELRMIRWMSGKTRSERANNESICEMVEVEPVEHEVRIEIFKHGLIL